MYVTCILDCIIIIDNGLARIALLTKGKYNCETVDNYPFYDFELIEHIEL